MLSDTSGGGEDVAAHGRPRCDLVTRGPWLSMRGGVCRGFVSRVASGVALTVTGVGLAGSVISE